jgi:hypothetical protein
MGTVELWRFRRKVRAIECFAAQGLFEQHFELAPPEVWILAPSAERLEHLRRSAWPEVPEDRREDYLFATLDVLAPGKVAEADWLYLDGEYRPALYPDAFEEPGEQEGA